VGVYDVSTNAWHVRTAHAPQPQQPAAAENNNNDAALNSNNQQSQQLGNNNFINNPYHTDRIKTRSWPSFGDDWPPLLLLMRKECVKNPFPDNPPGYGIVWCDMYKNRYRNILCTKTPLSTPLLRRITQQTAMPH